MSRCAWACACGGLLLACGPGLMLTRLDAAHRPPANVAVYLEVQDPDGEPVSGLTLRDFRIYEDGERLDPAASQQRIVDPRRVAHHHTLLLVDMSASVVAADQSRDIVRAATDFVSRVEPLHQVAIYAFDGSETIHPISPFAESPVPASRATAGLSDFETRDPATNLYGAVAQALAELDSAIERSAAPRAYGTLVVFTDGTDRAGRLSLRSLLDRLDASAHATYAIGVGSEIDDGTLARIGRSGYIRVSERATAINAFRQMAERIVDDTSRSYLLSYCSPARGGRHRVTIEAVTEQHAGQLQYDFDADGFGLGCDAADPPLPVRD